MEIDRMPPSNITAEHNLLSCLIINPKNIPTAETKLSPADFYDSRNRRIYETIIALSKKAEVETSAIIIALKNKGLVEYFVSLDFENLLPHDLNLLFYISSIKSAAIRREQIRLAIKVFNDSHNENIDSCESVEALKSCIEKAKTDDNTGIVLPADLFVDIDTLYEKGFQRGVGTGWAKLDEYYTVRPGEITVITGVPSHGKSTWLTNLMVNIADREAWKFAVFSPENFPMQRYCAHIAQIWSGMPFSSGYSTRIPKDSLAGITHWIDENFVFIVPKSDEMQIDNLIQKAMICVIKHGAKGIVFDPWNEIDHSRPHGLSETEYISKCLSKIRYFAREYKVHVWLVAHPTKMQKGRDGTYPVPTPYDISGSAHFRNKADNCLTVWRDLNNTHLPTKIYTQKIRFHEVGKIGECELNYNPVLQSYY